jgi:hypothetical protein
MQDFKREALISRGNAVAMELSVQDVVNMASTVLKGDVASQTIKGEMTFALRVSFPLNGQLNYAPKKVSGGYYSLGIFRGPSNLSFAIRGLNKEGPRHQPWAKR